jgi:hypothetical protein
MASLAFTCCCSHDEEEDDDDEEDEDPSFLPLLCMKENINEVV